MYKKTLSLLLVVAICLSFGVTTSFAAAPSTNSYIKTLNTTLYGQIPVFGSDYWSISKRQATYEFVKNFSPPLFSIPFPAEQVDGLLEDNSLFKVEKSSYRRDIIVFYKCLYANALKGVASYYTSYGEVIATKIDIHKPYIVYSSPGLHPFLVFGDLCYKPDGIIFSSGDFLSAPDASTGCKKNGQCIKCFLTDEEYTNLLNPSSLPDYTPPAEHSTAKLEVVNTVPNVNVKLTNNGNLTKGSTTLLVGFNLNSPTALESFLWKADKPVIASVRVGISDSGKVETTNIINALTDQKPVVTHWNTGRSYTLTLYAPSGVTEFGGDGSAMYPLDTVTFTVDGEIPPSKELPIGDTTYSPTPPQSPSTGDVNVIVNESGNITGVQQWDGNQWIIIEKIEINNNGGGSGGTDPDNPGGGTDPDNPTDPDRPGILDWLWNGIGKILGGIVDAISKILDAVFGRLVDLIVNLLQQIADAVVRVFDLLFTVLDRVLGAMTGGFTDFLKEFFYFLPPELVDGLTLTVIFGIILAIVRFFKGG